VSDYQLVKKNTAQWSICMIVIVVIVTGIAIVSEVMSVHCYYSCIQFHVFLTYPLCTCQYVLNICLSVQCSWIMCNTWTCCTGVTAVASS